jgi:hypothetical protein
VNTSPAPDAWDMTRALTRAGLVVPPLGATHPDTIRAFGKWHWGTRALDRMRDLYLFDVGLVAQNIAEHGPLFALSHGGHGANSYALSLVTTAPSGDVAYFTQAGIFGAYSDEERDRAWINNTYLEAAQQWAELEDEPGFGPVRWLAFRSSLRGVSGIVDLDALRDGADFDTAHEEIDVHRLFDSLKDRRTRHAPGATVPEVGPRISEIRSRLAEALRRLDDDAHLVIGVHGSIRYVQFATFRPNLRLETIGPRYLEAAGEDVSVDELVWLAEQGWHDADDEGNLWRHWIPADEDDAAGAAVDALVRVHGVTTLDEVWFQSGDDNALAALDDDPSEQPSADEPASNLRPERAPVDDLSTALQAGRVGRTAAIRDGLPAAAKIFLLVDYIASNSVLELLARSGDQVYRRHDGSWRPDPAWSDVLSKAPARSIVVRPEDSLEKVLAQVDRSTAGQPWKPFVASQLEMYWPTYRPDDPDLFDWSRLDRLP